MSRELSHLEQLVADGSVMQSDEPAVAGADCCRYCGCTEDNACILETLEDQNAEDADGDGFVLATCAWYRQPNHHGLGVCSHPECVKLYLADRGAP